MKTKFFSIKRVPKGFKEDLKLFDELEIKQIETITDWLSGFKYTIDITLDDDTKIDISNKTNLSGEKIRDLISCLVYISTSLSLYDDNIDDYIDDLVSQNFASKEARTKLKNALEKIKDAPKIKSEADDEYKDEFTLYQRSYARCLILPKFAKEYSVHDELEKYTSEIETFFPSILMRITTDGPNGEKDVTFILTEDDIDNLSKRLQFAKKQLEILKASINI